MATGPAARHRGRRRDHRLPALLRVGAASCPGSACRGGHRTAPAGDGTRRGVARPRAAVAHVLVERRIRQRSRRRLRVLAGRRHPAAGRWLARAGRGGRSDRLCRRRTARAHDARLAGDLVGARHCRARRPRADTVRDRRATRGRPAACVGVLCVRERHQHVRRILLRGIAGSRWAASPPSARCNCCSRSSRSSRPPRSWARRSNPRRSSPQRS